MHKHSTRPCPFLNIIGKTVKLCRFCMVDIQKNADTSVLHACFTGLTQPSVCHSTWPPVLLPPNAIYPHVNT